jgi:hypothetical protein
VILLRKMLNHGMMRNPTGNKSGTAAVNFTPEIVKEIQALVERASIFVLDGDVMDTRQEQKVLDWADEPMSPPFKTCWFETLTKDYQVAFTSCDGADFYPEAQAANYLIGTLGMLVNEVAPNVYDIFSFDLFTPKSGAATFTGINVWRGVPEEMSQDNLEVQPAQLTLRRYLRALHISEAATEHTNEVVRLRNPDNSKKDRFYPIRRIIRILPRKLRNSAIAPVSQGGTVDWSHRWEVRGHWRKVSTIGKDRKGDYCVAGFTWVNPFVKGPEEGELVRKTRLIGQPKKKATA